MKLSVIYLTRKCPRQCDYCAIRDNAPGRRELDTSQWINAFSILKEIGVEFNLILGNEPYLLGTELPEIVNSSGVPYAVYTSGMKHLFEKNKDYYFGDGRITNLSIGVDYPMHPYIHLEDDSYEKAIDDWEALHWIRANYPDVETHATITIHKKNYEYLSLLVAQLNALKVNINVNFIHWDTGGFDFFPPAEQMQDLMFTREDLMKLRLVLEDVMKMGHNIQNIEMLQQDFSQMLGMKWHCQGNPYGGPTVDSDGSLRVCGYRKGTRTSKYSIFDLPGMVVEWQQAVHDDAMDCSGCSWSCPWMHHYWEAKDEAIAKKVFISHNKSE